jgi:serine/threonine protein kinase
MPEQLPPHKDKRDQGLVNRSESEVDWRSELMSYLVSTLGWSEREVSTEIGLRMYKPDEYAMHSSPNAKLFFLKSKIPGNPGVIVKFFEPTYSYAKFLTEADLYKRHAETPGIIRPLKIIYSSEQPIMISEFYPAGDLRKHFALLERSPSREEVGSIVERIGNALVRFHKKGDAHRDIKASNILVTDKDDIGSVGLGDFDYFNGLIKHDAGLISAGTLQFMPPEAFYGVQYNPFYADQYAFAVLVYQLICDWKKPLPYGELHDALLNVAVNDKSTPEQILQAKLNFVNAGKQYQPLSERADVQELNDRFTTHQLEAVDVVLQRALSIEPHERYYDPADEGDSRLGMGVFINELLQALGVS